jgi:amino acid transporter
LSFVASTLAYVIHPAWASSGVWTAVVIISVYWLGTLLALRGGIGVIAKLASSGVLIGTLIPGALLVILGIVFLAQGNPTAAPMTADNLLPEWTGIASIVLIVSNFGAYSGIEMNAVHVNELKEPSKEFPKAMFVAMILVLCILILPPLVISWFIPAEELSLTAGVMQAFEAVFAHFGLQFLTPIVGLAIVSASLAGFMTWLSGPSRSLLLVAQEGGYLCRPGSSAPTRTVSRSTSSPLRAWSPRSSRSCSPSYQPCRTPLDVHDHHDLGVPAHVPVVVPGRDEPPKASARPPSRVPGSRLQPALHHGNGVVGRSDPHQLRAPLAVR